MTALVVGAELPGVRGRLAGIALGRLGAPYAFTLLPNVSEPRKPWRHQLLWAQALEADLPTLHELAVLHANFPTLFSEGDYWSRDERVDDRRDAWICMSWFGVFSTTNKTDRCNALAVCRAPLLDLSFTLGLPIEAGATEGTLP